MSSSKQKRITIGIIWGVIVAVLMGLLPVLLVGYLNDLVGSTVYAISSNVLIFGIVIGVLQGSSKATKGTFFQGPISIVSGGIMLGYIYSIFQGGMLSVSTVQQGSEISMSINMSNLLILFLLPPVVGLVKSVVQTVGFKRLQGSPEKKEAPEKKAVSDKKTSEKEVSKTPEETPSEASEPNVTKE